MTALPTRLAALAGATSLLSLAGCAGDATGGGGTPASIGVVTAPAATGTAGVALAGAPTFVVRDAKGRALGGVPVTIEVVAGGGTVASAPGRSGAGATPVGVWTLGTVAGENRLRIAVTGVKPETLTVTGAAGAPAAIVVAQGNDQSAFGGRAVATPVRFVLRDQFGNGVAGHALSLEATNGGTLAGTGTAAATATTGADGGVDAPAWTLARRVAPQTLVASLVGGSLSASAAATVRTSFDIDVRVVGTMTDAQRALFTQAAARLRALIVGDLPDVATGPSDLAALCDDPGLPRIDETIDDVLILAQLKPIDGLGKVLGRAGPCLIRGEGSRLPVVGVMEFDSADIERMITTGTATDVMLHEMMHVLGFSAGYFEFFGLVSGLDTPDVAFTGANGLRGCRDVGGAASCAATVPLENSGGAGTVNSHWREATFDTELMTGFVNGAVRQISLMTVGAFHDLGYDVNYDAKDVYAVRDALARPGGAIPSLAIGGGEAWEVVLPPRVMISRDGPRRRLVAIP
jgi:hypothetical protein